MRLYLKRILKILQRRSPVFILLVGFLLVLLIGIFDNVTGDEFVLDYFYLLPILFVTWFVSTKAGFATAVLATLTRVISTPILSQVSTIRTSEIWNVVIMLATFLAFPALLSALKGNVLKLVSTHRVAGQRPYLAEKAKNNSKSPDVRRLNTE
jgi:hypothetical protein